MSFELKTIHVVGYSACGPFEKTSNAVVAMQHLFPDTIQAEIQEFPSKEAFEAWLATYRTASFVPILTDVLGPRAKAHKDAPFVWIDEDQFIGGQDETLRYLRTYFGSTLPKTSESSLDATSSFGTTKRKKMMMEEEDGLLRSQDDNDDDDGGIVYDYDLIVIGGGSGGLAASKEAAKYGAKVAVLDYVKPSPAGSSWGLGGTCVNVGCIPKKLMHQSAIIGKLLAKDAQAFGWKVDHDLQHDWQAVVQNVQDYIRSLNFKYRVDLRDKKVKYENLLGTFVDAHTLECVNPKKNKPPKHLRAKRFIVAVGGRPKPLECPGAELAISSDDIFQLDHAPGHTCVIGASYVALECAGFLRSMGFPVTVMVRSILLRGFDQDIAEKIGAYMETEESIVFQRQCIPTKMEKTSDRKIRVHWKNSDTGAEGVSEYDTVLNATGRKADLEGLGLDKTGVEIDSKSGKLNAPNEQTNVPHIYAIGDVLKDKPELTPVAIQAGRLLAQRLYGEKGKLMDYNKVCTAVFTPLEYGCCGLSEEKALEMFGAEGLEVYHQSFTPLEWSLSASRAPNMAYVKLIVDLNTNLVVGFHYLGPNAGEITQAVGIAMNLNATYEDFIRTIGIHPTTAEIFTTLEITKSSGQDASATGC